MSAQEENVPAPKPMRLQRFLAQCGLGSRRDCEELISAGRVTVDGEVMDRLGTTVNPATQTVTLDGERLKVERKKYFMLNKPSGYLCTADDPEGRRLVLDLFPEEGPRLFTVGRLDENTTGLLVVTNDGDLAQKLAHPRYRIFRTYLAQVAGTPRPEIYEQLRQGLFFTEGKFRVHSATPVKKQKDSTWVEIVMTEGQNREIRRLFARVGHKIMKLERLGYGPLRLGKLKRGEYRELSRDELASLHAVLQRNRAEEGERRVPPAGPRQRSERPDRRDSGEYRRSSSDRSGPRGRSEDRGFGDRPPRDRSTGDRRPSGRSPGDRRSSGGFSGERSFGDRPKGPRSTGERSSGSGSRGFGSRPGGDRRTGERSFEERRPSRDRGERSERGDRDRPARDRSFGDRPPRERSFGDRPPRDRSFGDRPPRDRAAGDRPSRGPGDRSARREFEQRADRGQGFERGERTGRPQRSESSGGESRERRSRSDFQSRGEGGGGFRRDERKPSDRGQDRGKKSSFGERRPSRPSSDRPRSPKGKRPPGPRGSR